VTFLLGAPQMTSGGFYLMNLMDQNVGGVNLLMIGFLEMVVVMYVYGFEKFASNVELMLGRRPGLYWRICWQFFSPLTLFGILCFLFARYQPPTLGDYTYPYWAVVLGWLMTVSSVTAIPLVAVGTFLSRFCGDFPLSAEMGLLRVLFNRAVETLKSLFKPTEDWGPAAKGDLIKYQDHLQMVAGDVSPSSSSSSSSTSSERPPLDV